MRMGKGQMMVQKRLECSRSEDSMKESIFARISKTTKDKIDECT